MAGESDEVHVETDEARGGSTPNIVRWVLGISLGAAIVLLSAVWMIGAASQGDVEDEVSVSNMIQENEASGSDTDGIVSGNADELDTGDAEDPLNQPNQPGAAGGEQ